ncbi:hypothetical protein CN566_28385 [Bacillus wiedmannii]|uniref:hypothetical protein n=1 Tax=Bacillus wiedmannii TaxID=1890302 RepID=UPI000BF47365|nr:hypothetical protein [Bacillus wiedmannii]PEP21723.1 hypothetical protein CN566_28385 [Bacillus wiedmannii]
MKYFEFDKHGYWAMIAAVDEEKAIEVYVDVVAGENTAEVEGEGFPTEVTKQQAMRQYIDVLHHTTPLKTEDIIKDFNEFENSVVLIDSSLV